MPDICRGQWYQEKVQNIELFIYILNVNNANANANSVGKNWAKTCFRGRKCLTLYLQGNYNFLWRIAIVQPGNQTTTMIIKLIFSKIKFMALKLLQIVSAIRAKAGPCELKVNIVRLFSIQDFFYNYLQHTFSTCSRKVTGWQRPRAEWVERTGNKYKYKYKLKYKLK